MTWAEVESLVAQAVAAEYTLSSGAATRRVARQAVEALKIELVKRNWKGPTGGNDMAFFGSFEKAKR